MVGRGPYPNAIVLQCYRDLVLVEVIVLTVLAGVAAPGVVVGAVLLNTGLVYQWEIYLTS